MKFRTFLKPLSFIPALLMMYMIFSFSAQPGEVSSSVSYKASTYIVKGADYVFDLNLEEWQIDDYANRINGITRKLAHMTEYFLLAIAVSFPLYVYGLRGIWLVLVAGLICVAFAAGDEYHQSFVDGRAPSKRDVAIDSFGVFWGIILTRIIGWTGRMTIFRVDPEEKARRDILKERKRMEKRERKLQQEYEEQHMEDMNRYRWEYDRRRDELDDDFIDDRDYDYERYDHRDRNERYDRRDEYDRYDDRRAYPDRDEYDDRRHYSSRDDYDDPDASDELSEDMPLSRIFHRRDDRY